MPLPVSALMIKARLLMLFEAGRLIIVSIFWGAFMVYFIPEFIVFLTHAKVSRYSQLIIPEFISILGHRVPATKKDISRSFTEISILLSKLTYEYKIS